MRNLTTVAFISILGLSSTELLADTKQELTIQLAVQQYHLKQQLASEVQQQAEQSMKLTVTALMNQQPDQLSDIQLAQQSKAATVQQGAE
ncbi:hypothetical protein AGRI_07910 [Alishewanella agri BL06]|jgi:hypothetical protein|uniref:Uncharacterized protein n=1 Tax=Alishewanella agri BL06 TaxID=1195246 RepID=I9P2V2_9ALTE|nr:hypothetical protein [Alishewanella agri]EIW89114.1 hypothetical protein AGRI_07910 [Alishewanella agri BL06]